MKVPSSLFTAVFLVATLLSTSACSRQTPEASAPTAKPADGGAVSAKAAQTATLPTLGAAPAWRLRDLNGVEVSSDQFKGKVLVVDFWATWCPPCREEIPGYVELTKKYGEQGVVILGVSLDQAGPEVVKAFAAKTGINYPLVMGDEKVVAAFGGVEGIPTTFLIDRTGQIRDRKVGLVPMPEYEQRIRAVLN